MLGWLVILLTFIVSALQPMQASARDIKRCLAIQDIDQRVECFEGRAEPEPETTSPTTIAPSIFPSFDCNRAVSSIEILICSDSVLAKLDAEMGRAYSEALKRQSNRDALINDQRQWLSSRDSRCGIGELSNSRSCLIQMTTARILELTNVAVAQPGQPASNTGDNKAPLVEPDASPPINQPAGLKEQSASASQGVDDAAASKVLIESIQTLLGASQTDSVKFFKYNVDKKELRGFKTDMPILRVVYDERVFFDTDKDILRPDAMPVVKTIAATLRQQKEKVALFVAGHTDARGTDRYNLELSIRRAEGVARAVKRQDPGTALIWRVGFGKAIPIRPNTSESNMALNRRVEFLIASQAEVIATWIKNTKGLCEDESCGTTSVFSNFEATPIGNNGTKPIAIEIPTPKPVEIDMQFHPIEVGPPLQ